MPAMFLLITNKKNQHWCRILRKAVEALGPLEVLDEAATQERFPLDSYDLVIVDASATRDVPRVVCSLRSHQPGVCIVVVSASPSWRRAREAFRAGAMDYVRKSSNERKLRTVFTEILARIQRR